ncbi:MAG TPA: C40 family peptidase, partial [Gemmatimonadaceae bacterium]|nr:C40 family peptidase [Gemmatimonadaceae bacterium]
MTPPHSPAARAVAACTLGICALAAPLPAQGSWSIGAFISRDDALPASPTLGGIAVTGWGGPLGVRVSGAANIADRAGAGGGSSSGIGAWAADADVVLAPARSVPLLAAALGGFAPYAFAGIGGHGTRSDGSLDPAAADAARRIATWSYGGGVRRRLLGAVAVEGEGRYRAPMSGDPLLSRGNGRGWEYRAGLSVSFGGGRSSGGAYRVADAPPRPTDDGRRAPREPMATASAARVLARGERYLGTRYRYGGDSPDEGFDCSGFVQYVYAREGVRLPRTSRQMALAGSRVSPSLGALRPGDLVLFASNGRTVDHVAIYAGGHRIIHSSSSGGGVRYDDLDGARGRWFRERMVAARRVGGGASWAPGASFAEGAEL